MKREFVVFSVALLFAAGVYGQCGGGNLVANCSFENGDADWSVTSGVAQSSSTARSGAASLEVASEEISGFQFDTELEQCIGVQGGTTYSTGFFARLVSGSAGCWPRVSWHSNSSCSSFVGLDSFPAALVSNVEWTLVSEDKTSPATAQSASLDIVCTNSNSHFIVLYEDVFFVDGPVFSDGFESGDATGWSSTVGG